MNDCTRKPSIAVLMTCHNRSEATEKSLSRLFDQVDLDLLHLDVYLLDDGSTDGTSEMVMEHFPSVKLFRGDGSLFWNHGMRSVFAKAIKQGYDFYLWMNDDTYLYPFALNKLLHAYQQANSRNPGATVIVGSTQDPHTQEFTYGGIINTSRWNPLKFKRTPPEANALKPCYTMNGNCVLIDRETVRRVGNLDKAFQHRWGDFDYGLRAVRKGAQLWIAPGFVGTCEANEVREVWKDSKVTLSLRWKIFNSIKGFKFSEWLLYTYRHGGIWWILNFINPYFDLLFPELKAYLKGNKNVRLKTVKV